MFSSSGAFPTAPPPLEQADANSGSQSRIQVSYKGAGTQSFEPSSVPPRACMNRNWKPGAGAGYQTSAAIWDAGIRTGESTARLTTCPSCSVYTLRGRDQVHSFTGSVFHCLECLEFGSKLGSRSSLQLSHWVAEMDSLEQSLLPPRICTVMN